MAEKDIISKEIIRRLAVDLATHLLELSIDSGSLEVLPTEHQRVEDRRADLVVRLQDREGEAFILHVEIQNNNDDTMPIRMMRYMTDILLAHPGLPLRQYLIYIGQEPLRMQDGLDGSGLHYRYGILDMRAVHCRHLLEKDTPDALVLAVLCDFGDHNPQAIINHIYTRLRALLGDDHKRFREYVDMLHVLSVNRDLKRQIEEAEKMLTQINAERMPYYQLGMDQGMERGAAALLTRQLGYKFGTLAPAILERIENARPEELAVWERRILSAETIDGVFTFS